jgi:hypothetical protein
MLAQIAIVAVTLAARRPISPVIAMPFPWRGTHRKNQPLRDSDLLSDRSVRQYRDSTGNVYNVPAGRMAKTGGHYRE